MKNRFDSPKLSIIKSNSQGARFVVDTKLVPWSKLEDVSVYKVVQEYIHELTIKNDIVEDRLGFEMLELWK
ncbi:hypothetical protein [Tepidibacter sp. Z1-5]|uniref:hypothetical protein n=1 Tax=Tepidibacter sp. Z1-5 TaxID=3134138 RepID=UPI0030C41113